MARITIESNRMSGCLKQKAMVFDNLPLNTTWSDKHAMQWTGNGIGIVACRLFIIMHIFRAKLKFGGGHFRVRNVFTKMTIKYCMDNYFVNVGLPFLTNYLDL